MKFRKTRTAARSVYIYRFADGTVAVLHPGEQGVSTRGCVQSYAKTAGYLSQSGCGRKPYDTGSKRRRSIGNGNSASYGENQSPNQEKILIFLLMGFDFMLVFSTVFMEEGGA